MRLVHLCPVPRGAAGDAPPDRRALHPVPCLILKPSWSPRGADRLLSRSYFHVPAGPFANLFVAWFGSQRDGTRQPHSPKVCLPGNGWIPEVAGEITLNTVAGAITVN